MFWHHPHTSISRHWKKIFSILAIVCLYYINAFSESRNYKAECGVFQSTQSENIISEDHQSITFLLKHYIKSQNNEYSARSSRRPTFTSSRTAILAQKPMYFSVPVVVQAIKKAPTSIEFHECAIKLNDCSSIIHLFYLF